MGVHKEIVKQLMKNELLDQFKSHKASGVRQLSTRWLYKHFLPSLSRKELIALEEVFAEMINENSIEYVKGSQPTYRLTSKGEKLI